MSEWFFFFPQYWTEFEALSMYGSVPCLIPLSAGWTVVVSTNIPDLFVGL